MTWPEYAKLTIKTKCFVIHILKSYLINLYIHRAEFWPFGRVCRIRRAVSLLITWDLQSLIPSLLR